MKMMKCHTAQILLCLLGLVQSQNTKERIKQRTKEIMRPDSEYMRKINAKIKEMMNPKSKYMEEIRRRLGLGGQTPTPTPTPTPSPTPTPGYTGKS